MSYFPLDRDLLTSSLWAQGSPEAVKVWIYLLLNANPRTGVIEDAAPAIALRCGLSLQGTIDVLGWLASRDPHSRTKDHDGRRIEALPDGGFVLLNYARRRDKDHSTPRVKRYRDRMKRNETVGNGSETPSGTTNKNTNTETTEVRKEPPPALPPADQAERAIRASTDLLRTRLYALVTEATKADPKHRDPTQLMRLFTSYEKGDRQVGGVVNPWMLTHERLERSIADAETQIKEWRDGTR